MNIDGQHKKIYLACQHKFRGLVAEFKSKKFEKNVRNDHSFIFRRGYRELMLEARSTLHPSLFSEYLKWCSFHVKHQLPELKRYPTGYDELQGVSWKNPKVSLEREILWIAARVKEDHSSINLFRLVAQEIEKLVVENELNQAINLLKDLELMQGASFWSVQLRIALEGMAGGLEGQKKYTAEVRSIYRNGLLNFIAYNTSVRNEDRVSIQKYMEDIRQRISDHSKYDESIKRYMRHRLMNEWPAENSEISDVLRVEQSHSLVDVYETFVSLVQHALSCAHNDELKSATKLALQQLSCIDDYRITKVCIAFDLPVNCSFNARNSSIVDALCTSDFPTALLMARNPQSHNDDAVDAWAYIYSGVALSLRGRAARATLLKHVHHLIAQFLRQDNDSATAYSGLLKLTTNLGGLPFAAAIRTFIGMIYRTFPDEEWRPWLVSLNCPALGFEDDVILENPQTPGGECWGLLKDHHARTNVASGAAVEIFRACGLIRANEMDVAIQLLSNMRQAFPEILPAITLPLLLHALYSAGMRQSAIELIADEGSRCTSRKNLLPVEATIGGYSHEDYNRVTHLLAPSIALHMLWDATEDDEVGSRLRFKIGQVIRRIDVREPAKLFDQKHLLPTHQLVYFLRDLCIPNLVDQARVAKTTAEILQQRQKTCAVLRDLDPDNDSEYLDEIHEISNRQLMSDGQWIVDRTRIHVDTDALTRWATRELSEEFYRYRDLAEVVTPMEFDDVMRDILIENQIPVQFSEFGEADAVLYSMLVRIGSEFLNNSLFGLDYYLSKRIRHQSFVGLIRGPLELQGLITTKDSAGANYNKNVMLLERFNECSKDTLNGLSKAFENFSASFDAALIETKDKIIQIRSKEHPHGLVTFDLNPQIVPVARVVLSDSNMTGFVRSSVSLMWALLDKSLGDVRDYISNELKSKLSSIFDELRANLKSLVEGRAEYLELDRLIGESSVQVQLALDDASSWFSKTNDQDAFRRTFKIEQAVNISIEAARKCLRDFNPEINIAQSATDIMVMPSTLVFLHDVLFISLDNARFHSGLKTPEITIKVDPDLENERFVINVLCSAKQSARAEAERKLSAIRENIDKGEFDSKTKIEGGSGLYKIAAVVKQSSKGHLSFGFTPDGDFEITVVYNFLGESVQPEEAI
ncbi:hypothetical protein ACNFCJ_04285 [Pseudomonas sp. NY15364]|uniref:hypothetical protein n=1 Tax=Pseudomonas sp. NY15364 TaxID=3400353 RepID=UPI003A865004